ncbi:MAG TPA: DUF4118 domain-containing protein, partial [Candidatus Limnocylindrales bacterium]
MNRRQARNLAVLLGVAVPSLVIATLVVAVLRSALNVSNASIVYLAAVVVTAIAAGAPGAVLTSIGSILLYDFFFVQPLYTLTMSDPTEWLNAILLLGTGLVVGQLAALQRRRAEDAREREREAVALSRVSRELATRESTMEVLPRIAAVLRDEATLDRVWIAFGPEGRERVGADTGTGPRPAAVVVQVLQRTHGDESPRWVRVHQAGGTSAIASALALYRVRIEAGDAQLGSLWATRDREEGDPDVTETRLL